MSEIDELDTLAAEYVLGTLDAVERRAVTARIAQEPALATAIETWQRLLAQIGEMIPSVSPAPELFAKIEERLAEAHRAATIQSGQDAAVIVLKKRLRNWQRIAGFAGSLAAMLLIALAVATLNQPANPRSFVAVLQKDSASPAFLVSVNLDSQTLTVRPVAVTAPKGKSYELWLVNEKLGAPRSLGVLSTQDYTIKTNLSFDPTIMQQSTYAVSVEPEGGSPTGTATGPIVFTAPLIQAAP
jgi:anti-sigma-K factor RskA